MSDNSLVPSNMYENKLRVLEFHRDRCIIDLNPFFQDWFARRDSCYGRSVHQRWEQKENITRYQFTFVELFETFLASYTSNEFAGFLEKHLDFEENQLQSESLIMRIRNFKKDHRIAFTEDWNGYQKSIFPFNFPVEDLSKAMFVGKYAKIKEYSGGSSYNSDNCALVTDDRMYMRIEVHFRAKYSFKNLRKNLLNTEPPIILLYCNRGYEESVCLDVFDLICHYNLPRDGLKIVKK